MTVKIDLTKKTDQQANKKLKGINVFSKQEWKNIKARLNVIS